ncbi:threonine synthase [Candidatus Kaiserbacteria bacterium]|nr:threonine synthase [Candidatus Kaiserbacteria bacterium]
MDTVLYESTRGGCECTYPDTLLKGIAGNGGLFVPKTWPKFSEHDRAKLIKARSYKQVAYRVMAPYLDKKTRRVLKRLLDKAYSKKKFGSRIVPIKKLEDELYLLQVSEGPTWAFKDMALQLLAELLDYWLEELGEYLNIIVATSGDTGSAAIEAFRGRKRITVTVLSPAQGNMSSAQKKQMYGVNDKRVHNIIIEGDFDDCQALVKAIMDDKAFADAHHLGLVNSINWTRIIAQTVYFVWAWSRLAKSPNSPVAFSVPSGNFGDAYACFVALMMDIPIARIVVATNKNDVLDRFFKTGRYDARHGEMMTPTHSPSMDIKLASNFERLLSEAFGRDGIAVNMLMMKMDAKKGWQGWFDISRESPFSRLAEWGFVSGSCSDSATRGAIHMAYERYGVVLDPHTAVAFHVGLSKVVRGIPLVVVETARWEKFPDTIE